MSTLKVATIKHSDGTTTTEPSIPALDKRMASAWAALVVSSGTPLLADSYNFSSVTDDGVGLYTFNFTTAMNHDDMIVVGNSKDSAINTTLANFCAREEPTVNSVSVGAATTSVGAADPSLAFLVIFGGK